MTSHRHRTDRARTSGSARASTHTPNAATLSSGTEENVARRAYELYEVRGREDGHDWDDWLQAEREIRNGDVRSD